MGNIINKSIELKYSDVFVNTEKSFIKGYPVGSDISLINTMYVKPKKDEESGKYGPDYMIIVFKDNISGDIKFQEIKNPYYIYYKIKDGYTVDHNMLFIEKNKVFPVKCKYRDLKASIAEMTGNLDWYYETMRVNYKEADKLFKIPSIFLADMNIEDFYRFEFSRLYTNEPYNPTKLYFDIEVDSIDIHGDFPEPGEAPVNAVTIIDEVSKGIYTLLLYNPQNKLIDEFMQNKNNASDLKEFVTNSVGGWKQYHRYGLDDYKYKIAFFDEEIKLISTIFKIINRSKPTYALAWNMAFDVPYLIARIQVLGYDPADIICHPDFNVKECYYFIDNRADKFEERGDYSHISSYTIYLDQLITFASRRKGQRAISSFKLDAVGEIMANVRKLDYSHITTNIAKLPYLDYHTFVFYNVMDTIVQLCIEKSVADIDFVCTKCLVTNTRIAKVHRQTTYLANVGIKSFYNNRSYNDCGFIMGNNINKNNPKEGFPGAFVADPLNVSDKPKIKINDIAINILLNLIDMDYAALYPNIIDENNIAVNTMLGKVIFKKPIDSKEDRFHNNYFDRAQWFIEDLNSGNYLDFCARYLGLPTYGEMYELVIEYIKKLNYAVEYNRYIDYNSGKRIMYDIIEDYKNKKRLMYDVIDNNKKPLREMVMYVSSEGMKNDSRDF